MTTKKAIRPRARKAKTYVLPDGKVLVLRVCDKNMRSYGGFTWPRTGEVSAPDWAPRAECGRGLHGWMWGHGDISAADITETSVWLVVEVDARSIVDLSGKVKFPAGVVIHAGDRSDAVAIIQRWAPADAGPCMYGTATAGDAGTATAGYAGTATAGDAGTATAGVRGTATAGLYGCLSILWWDPRIKNYRRATAEVDGVAIRAGVRYRCEGGVFVEVTP